LGPAFQNKFHADLFPILLKTIDDPIPRVASHALAALTNMFEGSKQEITILYQQLTM